MPEEEHLKIRQGDINDIGGLLPPPELLDAYERLAPGSTEKILETFRAEASHRTNLKFRVVQQNNGFSSWDNYLRSFSR